MNLIFLIIVLSLWGLACADGPYSMLSPYVYNKLMSVKSVGHDLQRALGLDLNDIADQLVWEANQVMKVRGMDPHDLPDVTLDYKWALSTVHLNLTEGQFHGVSSMKRNGDIVATYDSHNKYFKMSQSVVLGEAVVNYDYQVKFWPFSDSGTAEDHIDSLGLHLEVGFSLESFQFKLDDLAISDSGFHLKLRTDNVMIQKILDSLLDEHGEEFHNHARDNFEGAMKNMAQDNINKINQYLANFLES